MGSATNIVRDKTLTDDDIDELCALLADVKLKAETHSIDTISIVGKVFSNSFMDSRHLTYDEIKEMTKVWVSIEDDPDVIDAVIDDEIEELGKTREIQDMIIESDSEEENEDLDNDVEMPRVVTQ